MSPLSIITLVVAFACFGYSAQQRRIGVVTLVGVISLAAFVILELVHA
ncbi:MAG TPA: hypothetical protein VFU07_09715 [Candidatus Lumbricidophila sp.]|nr:hypothetical protein [Candidatus Lumbricidophila sp.]